jgi:hypothetical protein
MDALELVEPHAGKGEPGMLGKHARPDLGSGDSGLFTQFASGGIVT